jgi:hydrogenase expression/formation protein HypC
VKTLADNDCSTCGDVAVPVRVIEVHGNEDVVEERLGICATAVTHFVPDVKVNEILLVHMGVAFGQKLGVRL